MKNRLTPEQDLNRLLDEDGGEFGAIYHRLSRPEPPRRLDRVVLANAARAVHGARAPRVQRWALALGSAAGVVLAAGIAWQVGKQMQAHESMPEGSRSMQDSRVVPVEAITESRPRQKAKSDLIMRDADLPTEAKDEVSIRVDRASKQDKPAPASSVQGISPPAPATPPAPAAAKPEPLKSREALGKSTIQQTSAVAVGQVEAEAFPEQKAAAMNESAVSAERMQGAAKRSGSAVSGNATAQESARAAAAPQPVAASEVAADDATSRNMQLSPGAWLEEIERLADIGQRNEAIENLRLFRSQYPDWPLPAALLQLNQ